MSKKLRVIIPLVVLFLAGVGFVAHTGFGNLSAIGWDSVSLLCPIGALGTMLASKTMVPQAVISLVIAVVAIVILGRAFCAWVCPVPVVSKLRTAFKKQEAPRAEEEHPAEGNGGHVAAAENGSSQKATSDSRVASGVDDSEKALELTPKQKRLLRGSCAACASDCRPSNSRHLVLGGALLSAAIFGFPVFCLICPIGLSFALVFVLINLFGVGDVTWSVIAIPLLLLVEVVFFRKWCSHICPISSLMSLISKANKTFRPTIDDAKCIEARGGECGKCGQVCEVGIDPRHPELGASWSECTKCRACVDACPGHAISMPLLPLKKAELPSTSSEEKVSQEQ